MSVIYRYNTYTLSIIHTLCLYYMPHIYILVTLTMHAYPYIQDVPKLKELLAEAKKLADIGGDWDRRNRLQV